MRSRNLLLCSLALACLLMHACALAQTAEQDDQDKVDQMNKQILSDNKNTDAGSYKGQPWATSSLNDSVKKATSLGTASPVQISSAMSQPADDMAKTDSFLKEAANNGFYLLSVAEYLSKSGQDNNWAIVDARPAQLFAASHIPDALNIPLENIISQMGIIPAGKKIAVYSTPDANAAFAVQTLRVYGGREAFVLSGGIDAWKAAGMPLAS
ncbi:MAG: rhodanese-like domain-containing protein [Methanothrix sp.]|nr:rhodanese-like domain-containing protein [Methanothrix sp.]